MFDGNMAGRRAKTRTYQKREHAHADPLIKGTYARRAERIRPLRGAAQGATDDDLLLDEAPVEEESSSAASESAPPPSAAAEAGQHWPQIVE